MKSSVVSVNRLLPSDSPMRIQKCAAAAPHIFFRSYASNRFDQCRVLIPGIPEELALSTVLGALCVSVEKLVPIFGLDVRDKDDYGVLHLGYMGPVEQSIGKVAALAKLIGKPIRVFRGSNESDDSEFFTVDALGATTNNGKIHGVQHLPSDMETAD